MPRPAAKTKPNSTAALGFEAKLWLAADNVCNVGHCVVTLSGQSFTGQPITA